MGVDFLSVFQVHSYLIALDDLASKILRNTGHPAAFVVHLHRCTRYLLRTIPHVGCHALSILAEWSQLFLKLLLDLDWHPGQRSAEILLPAEQALHVLPNCGGHNSSGLLIAKLGVVKEVLFEFVEELCCRNHEAHVHKAGTTDCGRCGVVQDSLQLCQVFSFRKSENTVHLAYEIGGRRAAAGVVHIQGICIVLDLLNDLIDRREL
mmetsp:Transcript_44965/g.104858  ORF Transcript_44965/g.104858 Transcript_44965/m.104858 type:complete len:207 (+) Transcript_44965:466-1086(+)